MDRTVSRVITGVRAVDGAGVSLVRVFARAEVGLADPFLMLDAFDSVDPAEYVKGFPWHPHRGIETITYLLEGRIEHGDSIGNRGVIGAGDCQWMTAGSGILHQEMPKPEKRLRGLQLWLNLPAAAKMAAPRYRDVSAASIPVVTAPGTTVRIVAGTHADTAGAVCPDHVAATLLDVELTPGTFWSHPLATADTAFAYLFAGSLAVLDQTAIAAKEAAFFADGDRIVVQAGPSGARFLFASARPLREPVAWGGPIVMNTREELRTAFRELDEGTFLRHI